MQRKRTGAGGSALAEPLVFAFSGPRGHLQGRGVGQPVPRGTADTLSERLARIDHGSGASCTIGGALPFYRNAQDYLWQARRVTHGPMPAENAANPADPATIADPGAGRDRAIGCRAMRAEPSPALYAASVAHALQIMARGDAERGLDKVVLARTLALEADRPIPQTHVFERIAQDPSVTGFRVMLPDDPQQAPWTGRALIGATPELLLAKSGRRITSHPLAGSARRQGVAGADTQARDALAGSDKDRREHAIVVEYILDLLAPHCTALSCPDGTTVTSTRSMWHLGTLIEGELRDPDTPSVLLAALLHPTPAVCGLPCARAERLINQLEPVARDFYAGAVGWSDLGHGGDGAWYVAIRCADICGPYARLYAGAGIVPGSDPAAETAETGAKFGAMLRVLGLPDDAGMPPATTEF